MAEETGFTEISVASSLKYQFTEIPTYLGLDIEDKTPIPQYHATMHQEHIDEIHKCINSLKDKRKIKLIKMRFGVKPYRKRSRKECEKVFKVSRGRIQQLEGDALQELRFIFLSEGIDHV